MFPHYPNHTIDIEVQAKKTLAFFSDHHQDNLEWQKYPKTPTDRMKNLRILHPIKNIKLSRQSKQRHNNSQSSNKERATLIPYKVCIDDQQIKNKKKQKSSHSRNPYLAMAKQNYKPHKTIRNVYSLTKQAEQKEEENGFDFMQYWIKHRFQEGAVNALVERLRDSKNATIIRF